MNDKTPCGCGRSFEHYHGPGGMIPGPMPVKSKAPSKPSPYRTMTLEEQSWTNSQTPRRFDQRVRVKCQDGLVENAEISFEDGAPLKNILRVVVSLESSVIRGENREAPDGKAYVFVSQFHAEIGRVVYGTAEAIVG